jgi:hypothetical protein
MAYVFGWTSDLNTNSIKMLATTDMPDLAATMG